jgi:hypothetical protein
VVWQETKRPGEYTPAIRKISAGVATFVLTSCQHVLQCPPPNKTQTTDTLLVAHILVAREAATHFLVRLAGINFINNISNHNATHHFVIASFSPRLNSRSDNVILWRGWFFAFVCSDIHFTSCALFFLLPAGQQRQHR